MKQYLWKYLRTLFTLVLFAVLGNIPITYANPEMPRPVFQGQSHALTLAAQGDLKRVGDLNRYAIVAEFDPESAVMHGQEEIRYVHRDFIPTSEVVLRLYPNATWLYGQADMRLTGARAANQDLPFAYEAERTAVRLQLPQLLYYGSEVNLDITWEAQVPTGYGQGYGIFSYNDHILSLGNWYPILAVFDHRWDVPEAPQQGDTATSDVSFYSVTLTMPQDWILAGTGAVESQEADASDGKRTWVLSSGPVRDVSYAASPNYQVLQQQIGETTVRYFAAPVAGGRLTPEQALQVATQAFAIYSELFGPYPYTHFDVAEIDCAIGGYEYPQVVFLDRASRANAAISTFEFLSTHEIAHQWFYGLVGNDQVREPWLDEAMANYAVALYRGAYHGESARRDTMALWDSQYPAALAQIPRGLDQPVAAFNGWPEYRATVYYAGAEFYDRIRRRLGDERFFAALRLYQLRQRYRRATTTDLLHAFSAVSEEDLSEFFGQWFYTLPEPQYPQLSTLSGTRQRPY